MIWAVLPWLAAYLVVALLVWRFGLTIVGESAAGRSSLPVVAALWLPALWVLVIIGLVAWFDAAVDSALADVFGPDEIEP